MENITDEDKTLPPIKYECKCLRFLNIESGRNSLLTFITDLDHTADVQ